MIPANEQACDVVAGIHRLAYTLGLEIFKGQDYLIGKPMPKDEVIEYIENYAVKFE